MRSEAQKKADRKYEAKTYATITAKFRVGDKEAFADLCAQSGKTVNAVLTDYVRYCISVSCIPPLPEKNNV